ncbi:hypothetical protein M1843_11925 [Isoptericola sp. 4D.3]|uniref:Lipoprotein n=1 Tax=Isoptericola peretonis TaxID=2918523 RepID=A0ABT0J4W3_9MICO|nr:hypothetical protein [Isoptericola sp. 4D.3]
MDRQLPRERRWARVATTAVAVVATLLLLGACAAGPNPGVDTSTLSGQGPYGFWWGLWQGMILPIAFVVSLFTDSVSVYEVHNNGNWYDVGYVLGVSLVFGGPFGASRARR